MEKAYEISTNKKEIGIKLIEKVMCNILKDKVNVLFICIGTDRCIGDAVGPIVGHLLTKHNVPYAVYGTLEKPVHATNINTVLEKIKKKYPTSYIIAIDACIGSELGTIKIEENSIKPGRGLGKDLPAIGDLSIKAIVSNSSSFLRLQNVRLNFVYNISNIISAGIILAAKKLSLNNKNENVI